MIFTQQSHITIYELLCVVRSNTQTLTQVSDDADLTELKANINVAAAEGAIGANIKAAAVSLISVFCAVQRDGGWNDFSSPILVNKKRLQMMPSLQLLKPAMT